MIPRACAPTHIRRHSIKTKASVSGRRGERERLLSKGRCSVWLGGFSLCFEKRPTSTTWHPAHLNIVPGACVQNALVI